MLYDAKKISDLAQSFSKATSEFEKVYLHAKCKVEQITNADRSTQEKLLSIVNNFRIDYFGKDEELFRKNINTAIKKRERIRYLNKYVKILKVWL